MGDIKAGGIYIDIEMDCDQLIQANARANQALESMAGNTQGASSALNKLETQATKTASAVNNATNGANKFRTVAGQMGYQLQDVAVQLQMGQGALTVFAQQGSQMAGAFGPTGAVVGAIIAVAGAIGSALIPALTKGGATAEDLQKTLEELDKTISFSQNGVAALSDKYALLAKTNGALAEAVRDNALAKLEQDAQGAGDAIKGIISSQNSLLPTFNGGASSVTLMGEAMKSLGITTSDYQQASQQATSTGGQFQSLAMTIGNTVSMLASNFGIASQQAFNLGQKMVDVANNPTPQAINQLNQYLATLHPTTEDGARALLDFKNSITNAGAEVSDITARLEMFRASMNGAIATAQQQQTFEGLINNLKQQEVGYKQGANAARIYAIEHANLNDQQKKEVLAQNSVTEAARQEADRRREAAQSNKQQAGSTDQATSSLSRMSQQYQVAELKSQGLNREAAQLAAVQSLGTKATNAEAEAASKLAGKIFDLTKAEESRRQAKQGQKFATQEIATAQSTADPLTGKAVDPMAQVNLEEQQKLAALAQYRALDTQNVQLYEDAKTAIQQQASDKRKQIQLDEAEQQRQNMSQLLGASSDFFGQMAGLVGDYAGESSGAYKAMFAVSKGFAIAQAGLNLQTAISNAMAVPFPANIPLIAKAVASGTQVISAIRGTSYGGGRKNGGPVSSGSIYPVGESNLPEFLQTSNGLFMIPGDNGRVFSNKDVTSGAPTIPRASTGSEYLKAASSKSSDSSASQSKNIQVNVQFIDQTSGGQHSFNAQSSQQGDVVTVTGFLTDMDNGGAMSSSIMARFGLRRQATGDL